MGRKIFFLSLRLYQKSTSQKPQSLIFISKLNLTDLTDWPNYFFKLSFGEKPTNWDNIFFAHQKSNPDLSKTPSDNNELEFSPKNYPCSKSPLTSLEMEQNLAKTGINNFSSPKSNFDGSEPHCDKNELRISSKNDLDHESPLNPTDLKAKPTTLEDKNPHFQDKRPDRFRRQPDFLRASTNALTLIQSMALQPPILRKKHGTSIRKLRYSVISLWTNFRRREPHYSYHAEDYILESEVYSMSPRPTPNEFPTATQLVTPDLTPTVTPSGSPTVSQTANQTVVSAKTDPHLDSDYGTDEDSDNDSSPYDNFLNDDTDNDPSHYEYPSSDPNLSPYGCSYAHLDMIFDDCEDFDYSIYDSEPNEPNEYTRCFGYDRSGPQLTPRPPDPPSRLTPRDFVEWQSNFSRMTVTSVTLISSADTPMTTFPLTAPSSTSLEATSPPSDYPPCYSSSLTSAVLLSPAVCDDSFATASGYAWDSSASAGDASCAETSCSCEPENDPAVKSPDNLPTDHPLDPLPLTINFSSLDLSDPPQPPLEPSSDPPAERPKHRHRRQATLIGRTKRPWLTPPLPSNTAWRGWVLSKTSMTTTRPPRQPPPSLDFSLSANERPHRRSPQLRLGKSKPPLRNTTPRVVMKTQWTPRSAARKRLERLRNQPPLLRSRCRYRQSRYRVRLIPLPPPNIDHPHENKKPEYKITTDTPITEYSDNNETITVFPPLTNIFDSFPEYKILMYWEVKAG
jgi:hypothetical protein